MRGAYGEISRAFEKMINDDFDFSLAQAFTSGSRHLRRVILTTQIT